MRRRAGDSKKSKARNKMEIVSDLRKNNKGCVNKERAAWLAQDK